MHWNGKKWARVQSPAWPIQDPATEDLEAMAGSSASNIWVVGWEDENIAVQFHWNGKNWSNKTYRGSFQPRCRLHPVRSGDDFRDQCVGWRLFGENAPLEWQGVDQGTAALCSRDLRASGRDRR